MYSPACVCVCGSGYVLLDVNFSLPNFPLVHTGVFLSVSLPLCLPACARMCCTAAPSVVQKLLSFTFARCVGHLLLKQRLRLHVVMQPVATTSGLQQPSHPIMNDKVRPYSSQRGTWILTARVQLNHINTATSAVDLIHKNVSERKDKFRFLG